MGENKAEVVEEVCNLQSLQYDSTILNICIVKAARKAIRIRQKTQSNKYQWNEEVEELVNGKRSYTRSG